MFSTTCEESVTTAFVSFKPKFSSYFSYLHTFISSVFIHQIEPSWCFWNILTQHLSSLYGRGFSSRLKVLFSDMFFSALFILTMCRLTNMQLIWTHPLSECVSGL